MIEVYCINYIKIIITTVILKYVFLFILDLETNILLTLHDMCTERKNTRWPSRLMFDYVNLLIMLQDNLHEREVILKLMSMCNIPFMFLIT